MCYKPKLWGDKMNSNFFSYANLSNVAFLEELYEKYQLDPESVDPSLRYFFEGMQLGLASKAKGEVKETGSKDLRIYLLIQAYRTYGHLLARCNPIATSLPDEPEELKLEKWGFDKEDLNRIFSTGGFLKEQTAPLKDLIAALKNTYCRTIGVEYMGIVDPQMESWIQKNIEPHFAYFLTPEKKIEILKHLDKAELFETFLHTKYVGQKRFSLEGGETLIPMLAMLLDQGAEMQVQEVVLGMAHRGRLNVLANILNKSYSLIFNEFEDHYTPDLAEGTGDVKYHKGFNGVWRSKEGQTISLTLAANPSHLESVDPVVEGEVRAKQEMLGGKEQKKKIVPILIHGDASVAGQGVVYETLQLCKLSGYGTGGTIHIVINNQIGFTTLPKDTRSTRYCTDLAKTFNVPVFHVNAEDPEGCVVVAQLATQLRQTFDCDVFIDLNCYRKYGHNESDEPHFTQPLEYQLIKEKKTIRDLYLADLIEKGVVDSARAQNLEAELKTSLQKALEEVRAKEVVVASGEKLSYKPEDQIKTAVSAKKLVELAQKCCTVPKDFNLHPKIERLLNDRLKMVGDEKGISKIDWGMGEMLTYASLVTEKIHVRLSGQDVRRGTFTHRHAVWVDQQKAQKYFPLSHLSSDQAPFDAFNSSLSEFAVLGFEYGYSLFYPQSLVIWEAQFGDFANGGQVIIDQYVTASEQKWSYRTNLTILLPHGYEGQGPEHSSGRMERYLQLAGEDNIRVANCTTPAQFFHLLRRQALDPSKKPLILFTPKALLRHPECVSSIEAFSTGEFQEVLEDLKPAKACKRLWLCSGKIYYDLLKEREKRAVLDLTILRLEQLYPFPKEKLKSLLAKYSGYQECAWIQEEHRNMGAWEYVRPLLEEVTGTKVRYLGRERSASTAAGSYALHKQQQQALLDEAFNNLS